MTNKKPKIKIKDIEPIVSIIIPVYNEQERIKGCLDSIFSQTYKDFEVLIVDDDSTDKTLEIVKKFKVKVLRNGKKDYDIGKAIGIRNARGKFLLFIDADNRLADREWLAKAVEVLENKPNILGVESWKFLYSKKHNLATRYHDLFGNADPAVFYLKNQSHLQTWQEKWDLKGKIIENNKNYVIVNFKKSELPTIGSQGFLTRKIYFKDEKIFQHIEHFINLPNEKIFCFLKKDVEHLAFNESRNIIKKLERNIEHYLSDTKKRKQQRYNLNFVKVCLVFLIMISLVKPCYNSLKGFIKIRDKAWFLHIYLSFIVPWIYFWKLIKDKFRTTF